MKLKPSLSYYCGLDLGGMQEFTALAVLEKASYWDRDGFETQPPQYAVRHLERYHLGTPYAVVCERLTPLFASGPLANSVFVVDVTGVGKPVFELLRKT